MSSESIKPTVEHVDAFIEEHEDFNTDGNMGSVFVMNKTLVTAVIERLGGKAKFLEAHAELLAEISGERDQKTKSEFHYSDEDNLKFWDENRKDILDNLERGSEKVGDESVEVMLETWFDAIEIDQQDVEAAINEPACSYQASSEARREVCSWLGFNAISDARLGFIAYMESVEEDINA